jgi:2-polyprenyl-6-methoxyphenol hydroxylase-like FAD-dependent oxidoreductase
MTTTKAREADIVIAGGGPAGLMLATEVRLGGADPVVLERLPEISEIPKGNGLIGQIVPMLDYRGLLERFRAEATYAGPVPRFMLGPVEVDFSPLGVSPLHILSIPQRRLEWLLNDRLRELGGSVRRCHELTGLAQDDDGVTVEVAGPDGDYPLRARYVVGCDGAHSLVRKQAGIGFPGVTSSEISRIGRVFLPGAVVSPVSSEVEVPGAGRLKYPAPVSTPRGLYSLAPLSMLDRNAEPGLFIVHTREKDDAAAARGDGPMTLDEMRASFRQVLGADLEMTEPRWLTRTVGNSRQAERYRAGRVLLAGDAAHVFGIGGSLNTGLLDAVNLGWKLAAEVRGAAPDGLLDSYHAERHLAGERAMMHSRAQKALSADGEAADALRELFGELLRYPEPLRYVGEIIEGSDVRYPTPEGGARPHPLVGRLAPDLRLETRGDQERTRVAELMRPARGVLLDFTEGSAVAAVAAVGASAMGGPDRVSVLPARCLTQPAPADALLIRPDGYVAWAAGPHSPEPTVGLNEAIRTWFGNRAHPRVTAVP